MKKLLNGVVTSSAEETMALASEFALMLPDDAFVALVGDLGAGKTTFARGMAKGLGVKSTVKSPSYNIYSIYETLSGVKFLHMDAYRLDSVEQFDSLDLDEILPHPRISCVEWADKIWDRVPGNAFVVEMKIDALGHYIHLSGR